MFIRAYNFKMNKITRSFIYEKPTTCENCDFRLLWKDKHNMNFKYRQGVFLETNDGPSELVAFVQKFKYFADQNRPRETT